MKANRKGRFRCIMLFCTIWTMMCIISCNNSSQKQPAQVSLEDVKEYTVPDGWESLLNKDSLGGWEIVRYGGEGKPYVKNGVLTLPMAVNGLMTGVSWVGKPLPVINYSLYYEARRMEGTDIFAGLSFPYGDTFATLVVGGWGGATCGLSSIDGYDASGNETTKQIHFKDEQWYPVFLKVTTDSIYAKIDTIEVVNIATAGKRIHLRGGTNVKTFTLTTYLTTGEVRNMRIKRLSLGNALD